MSLFSLTLHPPRELGIFAFMHKAWATDLCNRLSKAASKPVTWTDLRIKGSQIICHASSIDGMMTIPTSAFEQVPVVSVMSMEQWPHAILLAPDEHGTLSPMEISGNPQEVTNRQLLDGDLELYYFMAVVNGAAPASQLMITASTFELWQQTRELISH